MTKEKLEKLERSEKKMIDELNKKDIIINELEEEIASMRRLLSDIIIMIEDFD